MVQRAERRQKRKGCPHQAGSNLISRDSALYLEGASTYNAEEKQYHDNEATDPADHGTPKDTAGGSDTCILGLLSNVTGSVESDEDAGSSKIREAPIPTRRSAGSVVSRHESIMSGSEAILALACCDWEPDHVENKVQQDEPG